MNQLLSDFEEMLDEDDSDSARAREQIAFAMENEDSSFSAVLLFELINWINDHFEDESMAYTMIKEFR